MILIALIWARIPVGPDNFKRVVKSQTFKTSFHCDFESAANIVFAFETNFEKRSIRSCHTVPIIN